MSSLQRDVLKSRLSTLPSKMTGGTSRFAGLVPKRKIKDYTPTKWSDYFDQKHDVDVGNNTFRLYTSGITGPILLLLHGGGHSALSWAVFSKIITSICECTVVAIDFREHGETRVIDEYTMSADVLANDIVNAVLVQFNNPPPIVLLGHSMGGAIAVHIAVKKLLPTLHGLAVIDVVEGTALGALSSMQSFLRSRPQHFNTIEHAIEWSIRSGQLNNLESAKVSMPGQLKRAPQEVPSTHEPNLQTNMTNISEECEEQPNNTNLAAMHSSKNGDGYTWRVDLTKTEPYWKGWFENMSNLFLASPVSKLLILAGVDRLDKEMTIAQMQGKFQMEILANCGHMVHEDAPDKVVEIVAGFLVRQRLTNMKGTFQRHY